MSSAVSALEKDRRSDGGGGGYSAGQDAILDEIAQLGARLDAGFKQIADESDLERRRLMGVRLAPLIGRLERTFATNLESVPIDEIQIGDRSNSPPSDRQLHGALPVRTV